MTNRQSQARLHPHLIVSFVPDPPDSETAMLQAPEENAPRVAHWRLQYLPFHQVEAGMTLGEPVHLSQQHILRYSLPAGHVLTEDNLRQLAAHHAEFVCIARPDNREPAVAEAERAAAIALVQRIFEGADRTQPVMASFFQRVLDYRSL